MSQKQQQSNKKEDVIPSEQLETLKKHIISQIEDNQARVDGIKKMLSTGDYEIQSTSIAEKIIDEQLETA